MESGNATKILLIFAATNVTWNITLSDITTCARLPFRELHLQILFAHSFVKREAHAVEKIANIRSSHWVDRLSGNSILRLLYRLERKSLLILFYIGGNLANCAVYCLNIDLCILRCDIGLDRSKKTTWVLFLFPTLHIIKVT